MAIPSLEHQIRYVDAILLVRAESTKAGGYVYFVEEVLKSRYTPPNVGDIVPADFALFELIGYELQNKQRVVVFLALKKNAQGYDCIDFLPVRDGNIHYGEHDRSVYQAMTIGLLKERILNIIAT